MIQLWQQIYTIIIGAKTTLLGNKTQPQAGISVTSQVMPVSAAMALIWEQHVTTVE